MLKINLGLSLLLGLNSIEAKAKEGISFVLVGDYANIVDMQRPHAIFDAIAQMKKEAKENSPEDFDFFVTSGDNIYTINAKHPKEWELRWMMDLYTSRDAIKDLPIYPVRGNHEGYWED